MFLRLLFCFGFGLASRVDSSERVWAAGFSGVHSGKALIREGLGSEDCGSPGYPLSKKPRSVAGSGPYDGLLGLC